MSASEAGLITGLSMLLAMVMRAVIGMIADKMSARKTALLICCLGFAAAFFSMWFVPRRISSLDTSTNSTPGDSSNYTFLENKGHLYEWICLTENGQEICRYPASRSHSICRTAESKAQENYFSHQLNGGTPNSGMYTSQYFDTQKDGNLDITEGFNSISPSNTFDKVRDGRKVPQTVSHEYVDETIPCFYVDSDITTSSEIHTDNQMSKLDNQVTEPVKNFKDNPSPTENSYHKSMVSSKNYDGIYCLLNCTRRLITSSDPVNSDLIHKQPINESARSRTDPYQSVTTDVTFALSFLLLITGKSLYSASTSLVDAVAYTILGPYSLKWGQQRLWGTVGTGVTVLSITLVNDRRQVESFTGLFIACLGLSILAFLIGLFKLRADKSPKNKTFFGDLVKLLSSGSVRLFLIKLLFYGVMAGTVQNFTFWFLVDIGGAQITLGVCLVLYCVSSVILLRYSRLVLQKLGHANLMYLALVAYAIRYLVLSFLTNAWTVLPGEILHGVTYSLFWAAASSTASIVAPPGTQATSQGLAGAMYWDLGRGVGIIVSGQLLQLFGARWTFRAYSMVCVGVLPVFWMLDRMWPLKKSGPDSPKDNKEKESEVEEHLLKSNTINDFSLNNNEDKTYQLQGENTPATKDNSIDMDDSKIENSVSEGLFLVEDSKVHHIDLETENHQRLVEKSRENHSRSLSGTDRSSLNHEFSDISQLCQAPAIKDTHKVETNGQDLNPSDCMTKFTYIY